MWFIALIFIFASLNPEIVLFSGISDVINSMHSACLNFTPKTHYSQYYAAIVCGENLPQGDFNLIGFKDMGIYHLLVISGSHLVFLSIILEKLFSFEKGSKITLLTLGVFCFLTGCQPPVLRSFLSLLIENFQRQHKLFWTPYEVALLSTALVVAINPKWCGSYSLLLSYIASVTLIYSSLYKYWLQAFIIYGLMFLFLLPLAPPHFFSLIASPFLGLFVGFIVFPFSFFSYFFHILVPITDIFWKFLFSILQTLSPYSPRYTPYFISKNLLWFFAILFHFYTLAREKKWLGSFYS